MKELTPINYFNPSEFLNHHVVFELYRRFFDTGKHFVSKQFNGLIADIPSFFEELEKLDKVKKAFEQISEDDLTKFYFFEHHFLSIYISVNKRITVELVTDDDSFIEKISTFLSLKFQDVKEEKQIHMIAPDEYTEKIALYPMGEVSSALERQNYTDEVLSKTDFVIKELNSENPVGRMVLIDGSPGTGKSFLIRGILKELNFGTCVLVPVSMLEGLDKPTLIPLLMKNKNSTFAWDRKGGPVRVNPSEEKPKPIVLIIEDADSVLVPRAADNMSALSSLLNYTDGIFGSLFDLRIIATTNASRVEIEKALLRPGRLLKRIHVGLLPPHKAEEIYKKLTGVERKFEKEVSLATVYSLSKGLEPDDENDDSAEDRQQTVGF